MNGKHTPGPWKIHADGIRAGDENGFKPFGACGCCNSPWMSASNKETRKADAELIVAAPELLETCRETLPRFLELFRYYRDHSKVRGMALRDFEDVEKKLREIVGRFPV